jgi:hypothetical protein
VRLLFYRGLGKDFEKETIEKRPEGEKRINQMYRYMFSGGGTAGAKAQQWVHSWCV